MPFLQFWNLLYQAADLIPGTSIRDTGMTLADVSNKNKYVMSEYIYYMQGFNDLTLPWSSTRNLFFIFSYLITLSSPLFYPPFISLSTIMISAFDPITEQWPTREGIRVLLLSTYGGSGLNLEKIMISFQNDWRWIFIWIILSMPRFK